MKYDKHLSEPWFSLIKLGIKTCEGRLNKGDFLKMKVNDTIKFFNEDFTFKRSYSVKITKITKYNTFENYLRGKTLKKTLPGINTIKDGLQIYYQYYSKEDEKKFKIIAIDIEVI